MSGVTCGCMGFVEGDFYYSKRGGRPRSPAGTSCSSKGADATARALHCDGHSASRGFKLPGNISLWRKRAPTPMVRAEI